MEILHAIFSQNSIELYLAIKLPDGQELLVTVPKTSDGHLATEISRVTLNQQ